VRVVSLVPSATETVSAWGIEPVACTRFCERPDLPHVGGTKDPDVAAIIGLAPDLVVMDEEENRGEDAEALRAAGLEVHALAIRALDDVEVQLGALASRLGIDPGDTLAFERPEPSEQRSAFVPIWRRPWIGLGAGTYASSVLGALGVANVLAGRGRYPEVDLDAVRALRPDVVLAPSEPYPFRERHLAELSTVAPALLVDGQDLFWWGVRTPAALLRLAERLSW
jgi:ABC-type hemin transport system substrate-binding protein